MAKYAQAVGRCIILTLLVDDLVARYAVLSMFGTKVAEQCAVLVLLVDELVARYAEAAGWLAVLVLLVGELVE